MAIVFACSPGYYEGPVRVQLVPPEEDYLAKLFSLFVPILSLFEPGSTAGHPFSCQIKKHLLETPVCGHSTDEDASENEKKKKREISRPGPGGIGTHDAMRVCSRVVCSTAVLQPLSKPFYYVPI